MTPTPTRKAATPARTEAFTGFGGMTFSSRPEVIISSTAMAAPTMTFQSILM